MGISSIGGGMSTYGSKGMGGLMSGLDVDELVKGMTMGTSNKISKLMQDKQTNTWRAESYRAISSPLVDFASKYINSSSKTNLSYNDFFSKSDVKASGTNSKNLSIAGKSKTAEELQILAVKQLAEDASRSLTGGASGKIESSEINFGDPVSVNNVENQTIKVSYNGKSYSIVLKDKISTTTPPTDPPETTLKYGNSAEVIDSLNKLIANDSSLSDLKDKVSFSESGGKLGISLNGDAAHKLVIKGGTGKVMDSLGLAADMEATGGGTVITGNAPMKVTTETTMAEALAEKNMSFTYNGVTKSIKLGTAAELGTDGTTFAKHIQEKLDKAFGSGRIKVGFSGTTAGQLSFETVLSDGTVDTNSAFKISSADVGLLGGSDSLLKIGYGASNRVNTAATLDKSGLKGMDGLTPVEGLTDAKGNVYKGYKINVNGKDIDIKETDSIGSIMSKINDADAGVKVTYSETSDTFSIKATDGGISGKIEIKDVAGKLAETMFNSDVDGNNKTTNGEYKSALDKKGQDAEIEVDFDGVGQGADAVTITRGSNNFSLDGLNITVNQTFDSFKRDENGGLVDDAGVPTTTGVIDREKLVRFTANVNTDVVVDAIKQMADDYNKLVDEIQNARTQKHDRNYSPLTSEQKKEMSEDEIKVWEEKAKQGLLFNDSTLNILANDLRFVFSNYTQDGLKSIGISNSGTGTDAYQNNGKISIDEDKLRAALAERPDDVASMFTEPLTNKVVDGVTVKDVTSGGVMSRMKEITEKYAKTIGSKKGILIDKAGHPAAPVSMFSNSLQKANDELDKTIARFQTTLKSQEARYYKQFTQLEQLVSQMNSQSGALSELSGG